MKDLTNYAVALREIARLEVRLSAAQLKLQQANARMVNLEEDKARLDWLESYCADQGHWKVCKTAGLLCLSERCCAHRTPRTALDAARSERRMKAQVEVWPV